MKYIKKIETYNKYLLKKQNYNILNIQYNNN